MLSTGITCPVKGLTDISDPTPPGVPLLDEAQEWLTLEELSDATGLSRRTIRYYVMSGVVSGAQGQGPAARYPRSHVARLKQVRRWQDEGLQLAVIAQRLSQGTEPEILVTPPPPPESPAEVITRSPWERFELEPGVELHVRRPLTTAANRRVQRLLELATQLRQER